MQSNIVNADYLFPIYLISIIIISRNIQRKNILNNPAYKYFTKGLVVKLIGVFLFCLIYLFFYGNGDTLSYFRGSSCMVKLLFQDFEKGVSIIFDMYNHYNQFGTFNNETGYPPAYMWKDKQTFLVSRLTTPFYILGSGSFLNTSLLTCCFSYIGIWKLYLIFNENFKNIEKELFYTILCIPSLAFWGGGIMKDSYVLGACCWASYNFYKIFVNRNKVLVNTLLIIFNFWILINIKSYVAISLIPGMLMWLYSSNIKKIKNVSLKFILRPIILGFVIGAFVTIGNNLSLIGLEKYNSLDQTIESAKVIQQDLLREEQYGSNSYYIGELDGSLTGMLSLAPLAISTAIFRPFIWESSNITMITSAVENTILIFFLFYIILKTNPFSFMKIIISEPLLLFSFIFILLISFGVGVASTNFGALVRYKIPLIPFFYSMIIIVYKKSNN